MRLLLMLVTAFLSLRDGSHAEVIGNLRREETK
jgi:hypothetical protein